MNAFLKKKASFLPALTFTDGAVLLAGIGIYLALALSTLSKFSIWFDEAFGSYLVRFDFVAITRYTANDVHPPLYYWLLKLWTVAFGNTEVGIRSMSVFFAAVTIVFAFLLIVKTFGRRAAYVSLALLVLSPMFVRYGQEARMYTLLTAIIVAATYVLLYAVETKRRAAWIAYGVLIALGMLTQYLVALVWAAHFVWRFTEVRRSHDSVRATVRRVFDRQLIIAYGTALAIFCLWLPFLITQFLTIQGYGFWIKPVSSVTITDFMTDVLLFSDSSGVKSWVALGFYAVVLCLAFLAYKYTGTLTSHKRSVMLLFMSLVIIPPLLLLFMSMPPLRSAFVDRYLMGSVIFVALVAGVLISGARPFLGKWGRACLLIGVLALLSLGLVNQSVVGNYNFASKQSNNVRQLVEAIRQKTSQDTPILAATPWIFYESILYTKSNSPIYFINETTTYEYGSLKALQEDDTYKITDLDEFTSQHKNFWIIANSPNSSIKPLRGSWKQIDSIVINDAISDTPLFRAVHFSVE